MIIAAQLTLSLFSLRLTMTAVICWSMKIRIIASNAGGIAANGVHHSFLPKGFTIHPRCVALVG